MSVASALNYVVGKFSDEAQLRNVPRGKAFSVPEIRIQEFSRGSMGNLQHMENLDRLQNMSVIVKTRDDHYRLVHPIMIQKYRDTKKSREYLKLPVELLKQRGTTLKRLMLEKWAQKNEWSVVETSTSELFNQISKEPTMFRLRGVKGGGIRELTPPQCALWLISHFELLFQMPSLYPGHLRTCWW